MAGKGSECSCIGEGACWCCLCCLRALMARVEVAIINIQPGSSFCRSWASSAANYLGLVYCRVDGMNGKSWRMRAKLCTRSRLKHPSRRLFGHYVSTAEIRRGSWPWGIKIATHTRRLRIIIGGLPLEPSAVLPLHVALLVGRLEPPVATPYRSVMDQALAHFLSLLNHLLYHLIYQLFPPSWCSGPWTAFGITSLVLPLRALLD
jgi:hypothetical protein